MESVKHGISLSVSIFEDTFHTGKHKVDPLQSNPSLVHSFNSEDAFEKHIEEIDHDLRKFKLLTEIVDANTLLSDKHTTPLPDKHIPDNPQSHNSPHIPTLTLPHLIISSDIHNPSPPPPNTTDKTTWKRILRVDVEHKPSQVVSSGTKRAFPTDQQQTELPKKRSVVSHVDEENIQILAKAGFQPCQKQ